MSFIVTSHETNIIRVTITVNFIVTLPFELCYYKVTIMVTLY
jgi:hypothetical protein